MSHKTKKAKTAELQKAAGAGSSNKHITRISATPSHGNAKPEAQHDQSKSAHDDRPSAELVVTDTGKTTLQAVDKADAALNKPKKLSRKERRLAKKSQKSDGEKPLKSVFILARPFVALGRYIRDSWRELRQVRWPNRKATWKMTVAVLVYCAIFFLFILLLDTLFTFLFKTAVK